MKRWLLVLLLTAVVIVLFHLAWPIEPAQHWAAYHTGTLNEPGEYYGFWSGFGGILERLLELLVIGGILLHRLNCHKKGCLLVGRFPDVEGKGWKYCKRHHNTNGEQQ